METTIRDWATAFSGYAFPSEELVSIGIPVLKIGNVQRRYVTKEVDSYYNGEITKKLERYILQKKDFLIAMTGAGSVGRVGKMFECNGVFIVNQRIAIVRPKFEDNGFLYYWMSMPFVEKYLYSLGIGAGQPNISANDILNVKLDAPSLPVQCHIASILTAYDNLIENNNRRIRLLEQMAENLYKEWFVRFRFPGHEKVEFENGLPKGWKVWKIKNVVKRLPFNRTYKEFELEKEGKVIVIDQSTDEYLGFHNNAPSHKANYNKPILLFGDHSCKFQIMTCDFSLGENVIPFTTNDSERVDDYWLFYATHKLIVTEEYKRHWGRFSSMKILVPDVCLQRNFASFMRRIEKEKNALHQESSLLSRQRDLLLPRLMSGKLEV
jgi:type I restriction enzyme S subunit